MEPSQENRNAYTMSTVLLAQHRDHGLRYNVFSDVSVPYQNAEHSEVGVAATCTTRRQILLLFDRI